MRRSYNVFNQNILKNIFSLSFVQFSSYLFPIIITPIISRALGTEGYGIYLFFISITNYIFLLIDWGFQFYGPRKISLSNKKNHLSILYDILSAKLFLGFLIIIVLTVISPLLSLDPKLFILLCVITFGFSINPLFFFHGIGKIYLPALVNFVIRLLTLPIFYFMVKNTSDLNLVIAIFVFSQLLISLITITYLIIYGFKFFDLMKIFLKFSFFDSLKNPFKIFISNAFVTVYSNAGIILLGFLSSNKAISIFGSSMMFITVSKQMMNPISLALYPETVKMNFKDNYKNSIILKVQILVGFLMCALIFISANVLIDFFFGSEFKDAKFLLKLLSPIPILVAFSNFYGVQILLAKGRESEFMKITFIGAIFTIILLFLLIPSHHSIGAALSILFCEFIVAIGSIYYAVRYLKIK